MSLLALILEIVGYDESVNNNMSYCVYGNTDCKSMDLSN